MYRVVMSMSRIGTSPITVPSGVTLSVEGARVMVKGPKGELTLVSPEGIEIRPGKEGEWQVILKKSGDTAIHGLVRATLANAVVGVSQGWTKTLQLSGVGYRASMTGPNLTLAVGFSHPVTVEAPEGITLSTAEGKITVSGIDKQLVGQVAANIRAIKKPEPYKGKGIKYEGEYVRKKAGKAAKAVGGVVGGAK